VVADDLKSMRPDSAATRHRVSFVEKRDSAGTHLLGLHRRRSRRLVSCLTKLAGSAVAPPFVREKPAHPCPACLTLIA
jgi:hypothetical protein